MHLSRTKDTWAEGWELRARAHRVAKELLKHPFKIEHKQFFLGDKQKEILAGIKTGEFSTEEMQALKKAFEYEIQQNENFQKKYEDLPNQLERLLNSSTFSKNELYQQLTALKADKEKTVSAIESKDLSSLPSKSVYHLGSRDLPLERARLVLTEQLIASLSKAKDQKDITEAVTTAICENINCTRNRAQGNEDVEVLLDTAEYKTDEGKAKGQKLDKAAEKFSLGKLHMVLLGFVKKQSPDILQTVKAVTGRDFTQVQQPKQGTELIHRMF